MPDRLVTMPDGTGRYIPTCKICDHPGRARLIEADWADGKSAPYIAAEMEAGGWKVTPATILKHLKHVPGAATRKNVPIPAGLRGRDAAEYIKNRILDAVDSVENRLRSEAEAEGKTYSGEFILDKDLQPALGTALKAEGIKIKREDVASKRQIGLFQLMLGNGGKAPPHLIGDGMTIEGEFTDVTDDEEDEDAEEEDSTAAE